LGSGWVAAGDAVVVAAGDAVVADALATTFVVVAATVDA
jgi:hypothetical protein